MATAMRKASFFTVMPNRNQGHTHRHQDSLEFCSRVVLQRQEFQPSISESHHPRAATVAPERQKNEDGADP
jgi:hypothetical protein